MVKTEASLYKEGERTVCYEVYALGDHVGYSNIFEEGGYGGFVGDDLGAWLEPRRT